MEQVAQPRQSTTGTLALATLVLGAIVFGMRLRMYCRLPGCGRSG
jgi:hypothetical protein